MKFRFSLRTLALLLTLVCVLFGGTVSYIRYYANRQRHAVARLRDLGVDAAWPIEDMDKPSWLTRWARRWIDADAFRLSRSARIKSTSQNLDEAVEFIAQLQGLEDLSSNAPQLNDVHLGRLAEISGLKTFSIFDGNLSQESVRLALSKHDWERLDFEKVQFNDAILAEVGQMKNLTHIFFDASQASGPALEKLQNCSSLMEIYTSGCNHAGALARAARKLPKMREMIFTNATIDEEEFREFADIGGVSSLHFWECKIDCEEFGFLANNQGLAHLEFAKSPVSTKVIEGIERLSKLRILFLDAPFTDADAERISRLPMIYLLGFTSCDFTDQGLQRFANARALKNLVIPRDTKCTAEGIRSLQAKKPVQVVVGAFGDGTLYEPNGNIKELGNKVNK